MTVTNNKPNDPSPKSGAFDLPCAVVDVTKTPRQNPQSAPIDIMDVSPELGPFSKDIPESSSRQITRNSHRIHKEAAIIFLTNIDTVHPRKPGSNSGTPPSGLLLMNSKSGSPESPKVHGSISITQVPVGALKCVGDSGLLGNLSSPDSIPKGWATFVDEVEHIRSSPGGNDAIFDLRPELSVSPPSTTSSSSSQKEEVRQVPTRTSYFASQRSQQNIMPFALCTILPYDSSRQRRFRSMDQSATLEERLDTSTPPHPFKLGKAKKGRNTPTYYRQILWPYGLSSGPEDANLGCRPEEKTEEKVEERVDMEDGDKHEANKRVKAERLHRDLTEYDPLYLDDPDKKCEKRRKLLCLTSYRTSIIPYVKKKDLKASINEQMVFTHPWIEDLRLTLTAIRKIKNIMMNLTGDTLEVSTIAYAVVYFEKIILKKRVNKENRKLMAAICVMLAVKFWEPSITSESRLDTLVELLEESFGVTRKHMFSMEMTVFAELDFRLLLPGTHVYPHFVRLLAEHYGLMPQEYAPIVEDPAVTQPGYHFPEFSRGPERMMVANAEQFGKSPSK